MRRILLVLIASLWGAGSLAFGRPLSLAEAVRTALAANPEIAAAEQDVAVAQTKFAQVRAADRLQSCLDASFIHLNEALTLEVPPLTLNLGPLGEQTINLPGFALAKQDSARATISVHKAISTGGRVTYGLAQVTEGVAALQARAESTRREVAYHVVKAYLAAVLAQRVAEVTDQAYDTVTQHEAQAKALTDHGLAPKYEWIRAQTEVANQAQRRLEAHNQADLAKAYLLDVMGNPGEELPALLTPLRGSTPVTLTLEEAAQAALAASSDKVALEARDRLFAAAENAVEAEKKPVVAAVASMELNTRDLPVTTPEAFVGVVAKFPLLDGGLAEAKAREQAALRTRNRSDMTRLTNGIRLEVRKYYLDATSARTALNTADQAIILAQENLRLATRRFEEGVGTSIEKMDAILALSIAETNREAARYQYDVAYYGLQKAMGKIVSDFDIAEERQ